MPKGIYPRPCPIKLFWRKVDKINGPIHPVYGRCWVWMAHKDKDGYGTVRVRGNPYRSHVYSWRIANGRTEEKLWILHKCDNPSCVNPQHLFLGTAKDNSHDRDIKGRKACTKGTLNGQAKLTEDQVRQIRSIYVKGSRKYSLSALAKLYRVHRIAIRHIVIGRTWNHI